MLLGIGTDFRKLKIPLLIELSDRHGYGFSRPQAGNTGMFCLISATALGASGPLAFQPADCLFLFLPAFIRWFRVELLVLESPDDAFTLSHAFETLQALLQAFVLIDEYLSHDSSTMLFQHPKMVRRN
jgi:hypothetical protein